MMNPSHPSAGSSPLLRSILLWGLLVLGVLLLAACRGSAPVPVPPPLPEPEPDPLAPLSQAARLYYDNSGGIADSVRIVIRDEAGWTDLWSRATSRQSSPPNRPTVDFEDQMVVAVGAGRMTPQDRIQVDSAGFYTERTVDGEEAEYFVVVVRTFEGCRLLDSDAFPLEIVRVPRFDGPIRWEERRQRQTDCPQSRVDPPTPGSDPPTDVGAGVRALLGSSLGALGEGLGSGVAAGGRP